MFKRLTVKDLKDAIKKYKLPDNTIICMYSDSEGNEQSTAFDYFVDAVGLETKLDEKYTYVGGQDIFGIDLEKDKNRVLLILQPSR